MRCLILFLLICCPALLSAQTQTGDVFREYVWLPDSVAENGKFLRVGGRLDYQSTPTHFPADLHEHGHITLPNAIDLDQAIRAEVVLEVVQSHEDTKGLRIQINGNDWLEAPKFSGIPQPQSAYMYHAYPVVPIPVAHLKAGNGNTFKLEVDSVQSWNWPQNLIYGLTFRIYYHASKSHTEAKLAGIREGGKVPAILSLSVRAKNPNQIRQVDYIGFYEDTNWEGDGIYRQWHYHSHRGVIRNHIGTAEKPPFALQWDTAWLPDQSGPIKIAARITNTEGLVFVTQPVTGLILDRKYSVELCKPYDQPENWVTRSGEHAAHIAIKGAVAQAAAYQLIWKSWSPCYMTGLLMNGKKVLEQEGPCYDYYEHTTTFRDVSPLKQGENTITTGKTPLHDGKMVHGMEVHYPGIMMKVKYPKKQEPEVHISECTYEGRAHYLITTPGAVYYYDRAGGGISRMLDQDGKDWIAFKKEPWDTYPASAASAYRGIPNLVFRSEDAGAGHPGHDQCVSEKIGERAIRTVSKSGKWQWTWEFFDHYVQLRIQKVDPDHPYWFLYEGTPGGHFQPDQQYFGTENGGPRNDQLDYYAGDKLFDHWQWAYFGYRPSDRILYIAQLHADEHVDTFAYLGNSEEGIKAENGMVVFGFGRAEGAQPLLKNPNTFFLGFFEKKIESEKDHVQFSRMIKKMLRSKQN